MSEFLEHFIGLTEDQVKHYKLKGVTKNWEKERIDYAEKKQWESIQEILVEKDKELAKEFEIESPTIKEEKIDKERRFSYFYESLLDYQKKTYRELEVLAIWTDQDEVTKYFNYYDNGLTFKIKPFFDKTRMRQAEIPKGKLTDYPYLDLEIISDKDFLTGKDLSMIQEYQDSIFYPYSYSMIPLPTLIHILSELRA